MFDTRTRRKLRRIINVGSNELRAIVTQKSRALGRRSRNLSEDLTIKRNYAKYFCRSYDAVVLDYDGTIVSMINRDAGLRSDVIQQLGALLDSGIPVVVISGRGRSLLKVRRQLSRFNQGLLFLAMYNGSAIVQGSSAKPVVRKRMRYDSLASTFRSLNENTSFRKLVSKLSLKPYCIEIVPKRRSASYNDMLCRRLRTVLQRKLVARSSGYAVDIYPISITKDTCLNDVNRILHGNLHFLRVGDQGHELGNDYELLNSVGGFSVGTISANPRACFPVVDSDGLSIVGTRGVVHLLTKTFRIV